MVNTVYLPVAQQVLRDSRQYQYRWGEIDVDGWGRALLIIIFDKVIFSDMALIPPHCWSAARLPFGHRALDIGLDMPANHRHLLIFREDRDMCFEFTLQRMLLFSNWAKTRALSAIKSQHTLTDHFNSATSRLAIHGIYYMRLWQCRKHMPRGFWFAEFC